MNVIVNLPAPKDSTWGAGAAFSFIGQRVKLGHKTIGEVVETELKADGSAILATVELDADVVELTDASLIGLSVPREVD